MPLYATPRSSLMRPGASFWLDEKTRILFAHPEARGPARDLAGELARLWIPGPGVKPPRLAVRAGAKGRNAIVLRRGSPGKGLRGEEAFALRASAAGVVATARTGPALRLAARALAEHFDPAGYFPGGTIADAPAHAFRALLVHLTHYDPWWWKRKRHEKQPDMKVAERIIRAAAAARFNALIVDVADGVVYRSHPELKRPYSITMAAFRKLVRLAASLDLEVIPKLNFAKSFAKHHHNAWMRPHNKLPDDGEYYRHAFALMEELLDVTGARRFHIGMDEDEEHSLAGYVHKVKRLNSWLKARGVRTVQWVDLGKPYQKAIERKMRAAVGRLPKDVILTHWQYHGRLFHWIRFLRERGYQVLGGTGGRSGRFESVRAFAARAAAQGAMGMVSTHWTPLQKKWEPEILASVNASGRAFWQGG